MNSARVKYGKFHEKIKKIELKTWGKHRKSLKKIIKILQKNRKFQFYSHFHIKSYVKIKFQSYKLKKIPIL